MRVKAEDLCYSCRRLPAGNGMSIGEVLTTIYNDPEEWLPHFGGEKGVALMLNKIIVMGDGCTTCSDKVLRRVNEL